MKQLVLPVGCVLPLNNLLAEEQFQRGGKRQVNGMLYGLLSNVGWEMFLYILQWPNVIF
jgi:hypothetical protein